MPLSTIERPRMGPLGGPAPVTAANPIYHRRTAHTPPQTPPYHGTLNGHQVKHILLTLWEHFNLLLAFD